MNPYTTTKVLHHTGALNDIRMGRMPIPIQIQLIISDLCNQNCRMCCYRMDGYTDMFAVTDKNGIINRNPKRLMPFKKLTSLVCEFADIGVKAIQLTGGGEPTVHPQCAEILHLCNCLGMETAMVTNGQKLNEEICNALMDATWVRISIDAGTPETYQVSRETTADAFGTTIKNVEALVRLRNDNAASLIIGIGFVVNKDNWQEIIKGVKLARSLGVDNIRIGAAFTLHNLDYFEGFRAKAAAMAEEAVKLSTESFTVVNNFPNRISDLHLLHPDYRRCCQQYLVPFVGADFHVYRCCVTSYTKPGFIGSIGDATFSDVWFSQEHVDDMQTFNAAQCPRCQFNDRNRESNQIIERMSVNHVNFP